jgi:hypothetical protein
MVKEARLDTSHEEEHKMVLTIGNVRSYKSVTNKLE